MYIISKFKDYYDGVVGTVGLDKTIIYERETIEIENDIDKPKVFRVKPHTWRTDNLFIKTCRAEIDKKKTKKYDDVLGFIVGFCGKLYVGWKFEYKEKSWDGVVGINSETKTDIIYGYENAKEILKVDFWNSSLDDDMKYIENYDPINIFREINSPVFILAKTDKKSRNNTIFTINPNLKDYEFYKVIDAFTAFNEIEMFISGVLGTGENKIIEIDDKYKIMQHGFDYKWSFRKESNKKK